jgi:hypothetical protein
MAQMTQGGKCLAGKCPGDFVLKYFKWDSLLLILFRDRFSISAIFGNRGPPGQPDFVLLGGILAILAILVSPPAQAPCGPYRDSNPQRLANRRYATFPGPE